MAPTGTRGFPARKLNNAWIASWLGLTGCKHAASCGRETRSPVKAWSCRGKNSREVADGPFTESKEVIGGYLVLQVAVLDEAVAIARQCPTLDFGITVEVRPMLDECPISARLREKQTCATA